MGCTKGDTLGSIRQNTRVCILIFIYKVPNICIGHVPIPVCSENETGPFTLLLLNLPS